MCRPIPRGRRPRDSHKRTGYETAACRLRSIGSVLATGRRPYDGAMSDAAFTDALAREAARLPLLRACTPEETLATITPALPDCGITRSASVTHLDTFGIPVWVSVRPGGQVLQISNGKGVSDASAQVSALMEACELHLAENPRPERLWHGSMAQLAKIKPDARVVLPEDLPCALGHYFSPDFIGEWTSGTDLGTGGQVWVPSSVVYFFRRPSLFETSSNGLASGNTQAEAQLHALYELIERDAMCALGEQGRLKLRERGQVIDPDSVTFPVARLILDRCAEKGTRVVLMKLPAPVAVSAIWAVFLNERTVSTRSLVNTGWGAHDNPEVALTRALTEAAQSRLAKIHGARDDIRLRVGAPKDSRAYRVLESLTPDISWKQVEEWPRLDLPAAPEAAVPRLVDELIRKGKGPVYDFDLGKPETRLYCARIIAPSLAFRKLLF